MSISKQAALGAIASIVESLDRAYTGFAEVVDACVDGTSDARRELEAFSHFDFDPRFKTRVISVPLAIQSSEDLWNTIKELFVTRFKTIEDDSTALIYSLRHLPPRIPGEPILQRTALVLNFIHAFNSRLAQLIKEILDVSATIEDIKHRIETLDDLFLSQSSTKKVVDIKYRKRHSAS